MKYFTNVTTLEELKKEYKENAIKLHPDISGYDSTEDFQQMQKEFDIMKEKVKNVHKNSKNEYYEKETEEDLGVFKDIVNKIIHFENVNIELIGSWIWVSGMTKPYREEFKKLGFKWSQSKLAWYYHFGTYIKMSSVRYTLDDLRINFGSKVIENEQQEKLKA